MARSNSRTSLVDQRDLLELLKQHPLPTPFNLSLYTEDNGIQALREAVQTVCDPTCRQAACDAECLQRWQELVSRALLHNEPLAGRCGKGWLGFAVPLPGQAGIPDCLLGGGVREKQRSQPDDPPPAGLPSASALVPASRHQPFRVSREEAGAIADELFRALPRLLEQKLHTLSLERTTRRLEAVREVSRELARCPSAAQALTIVSEALVVLFDLPKVLIVLRQPGSGLSLHSTLGLEDDSCRVESTRLLEHLARTESPAETLSPEELDGFFPGLQAESACLFPMTENDRCTGAVLLLDVDLHVRDRALIELLVGRLAARIDRLRLEEGHERERLYSTRLVAMISALSLIDSREKLLNAILEMSAELMGARTGSLMLLEESEGTLTIAAARGMASALAKSMVIPFGEGIAGRVAKSGFPMLVNDIERDTRTATRNRPRFQTKSFISLPLKAKERLVGVLNLADKETGSSFTEADLNLVQTFTGHAVQMIERAATLEQAGQYEKLSVTDSLTGLYNRRFLEARLQEELNRCQRQGQSFCVILADLDNFKLYNDICGHLAGDRALRKAARLMRRTAREMDVVTRYGGEEFCLVLPGTTKKESVFVGERVRRTIEAESFPGESHLPLGRLTISLGVAVFPEDGRSSAELVHAADLALYRAKDLGRNRLVLYEPSFEKPAALPTRQQEKRR